MSLFQKIRDAIAHTPKRIGKKGEDDAAHQLDRAKFWGYRGKMLRNVYVPKDNGGTTEIDLLYITRKGVFVIESKNYSGYIFGAETSRDWTVTLYAGKNWWGKRKVEKYHFYNPIWQNSTHIYHLKKYLPEDVPVFSVIVFSDRCQLKEIDCDRADVVICQQSGLFRELRRIWRRHFSSLTNCEIEDIYEELLPFTMVGQSVKHQHVKAIRSQTHHTEICPWCGGELVMRLAGSGPHAGERFYGCSNYPRCKYIRNLGDGT